MPPPYYPPPPPPAPAAPAAPAADTGGILIFKILKLIIDH
jgi:hypothetical protein